MQPLQFRPMARVTISIPDEILEELKATKPSHRPTSQHIVDLVIDGMKFRVQSGGNVQWLPCAQPQSAQHEQNGWQRAMASLRKTQSAQHEQNG